MKIDVAPFTYKPMPESTAMAAARDRVAVWATRLDLDDEQVDYLTGLLSPDERTRARRFHFDKHRRQFIAARGILRILLGRYLNRLPDHIRLVYGSAGKPALASDEGVRFNLSHSQDTALYAITYEREVGVDIEFVRPIADMEQLAVRCFSSREYVDWKALPEDQKQIGFFNCWTRKEAYIKAIGEGLSHPLDQFDVSLRPGQAARLLNVKGRPMEAKRWSLQAVNPAQDYAAAVAVEGQEWSLECWQWSGTFTE